MLLEYFSCKFCLNCLTLILSASPNAMHFAHTFLSMRAQGVRLTAIEEVRNYEKIVYVKNIFENGWWEMHTPHPTPIGSAPGHKLHKPSKESGMFQSLDIIRFVFFLLKDRVKKGREHGKMVSLYIHFWLYTYRSNLFEIPFFQLQYFYNFFHLQ